jgi:hypothetical protein
MTSPNYDEEGGMNEGVNHKGNVAGVEDGLPTNTSGRRINNRGALCCMITVNICFIILFLYSAIVQDNDGKYSVLWNLFYGFHAAVYSVWLVLMTCCPDHSTAVVITPLQICIGLMIIWSIVLIITSSIIYQDADNEKVAKEENDVQFTDSTEKIFDITGAGIGLLAAFYHLFLLRYCFIRPVSAQPPTSSASTTDL